MSAGDNLGLTPLQQITLQDFENGHDRRYGTSNPERLDIPFWNATVKGGYNPYIAKRVFVDGVSEADIAKERVEIMKKVYGEEGDSDESSDEGFDMQALESSLDAAEGVTQGEIDDDANSWGNPIWCNDCMFSADVQLPDGRTVQIGGEREDFYDPNFLVYNDVIVFRPEEDGSIKPATGHFDIYGYPEHAFPPTDSHSATLLLGQKEILILGNKSTPQRDVSDSTPVYMLNVATWKMTRMETTGRGPGLIWNHQATLQGNVLRVEAQADVLAGQTECSVMVAGKRKRVPVQDNEVWNLDLGTMVWRHEESSWQTVTRKPRWSSRVGVLIWKQAGS